MDKLLVPVDGSEPARRALRFAVDFAKRCGVAEIELLNVQPRVDSGLVRAQLSAQAIEAALRSMGDRDAGDIPCAPRRSPDRLPPHVAIGHFGATICRRAIELGCSQIVMGSRGMGAIGNMVLGSVATQVIHLSPLPVTLVKETDVWSSLFDPVLVPTDGSDNAVRGARYVVECAKRSQGSARNMPRKSLKLRVASSMTRAFLTSSIFSSAIRPRRSRAKRRHTGAVTW